MVLKRLLHFCTVLIILTFDHILCSGSWPYDSMMIKIHISSTTLTFQKEGKLLNRLGRCAD